MAAATPALDDLLTRAARGLRRRWAAALEPMQITPHSARALQVVAELGRPRLGVLAERLRITPRSATEVVDALQERGFVERVDDAVDRRVVCVTLTEAGRSVLEEIAAARRRVAGQHFAPLAEREREVLGAILQKIDDADAATAAPRPRRV